MPTKQGQGQDYFKRIIQLASEPLRVQPTVTGLRKGKECRGEVFGRSKCAPFDGAPVVEIDHLRRRPVALASIRVKCFMRLFHFGPLLNPMCGILDPT